MEIMDILLVENVVSSLYQRLQKCHHDYVNGMRKKLFLTKGIVWINFHKPKMCCMEKEGKCKIYLEVVNIVGTRVKCNCKV